MTEKQDDVTDDPANPALDEFVESVAKVNDGLSDMISCMLRMQVLMMEDARNMIAEFSALRATGVSRGTDKSDI